MSTVEQILEDVYGDGKTAAHKLGVAPSAVSNWKARGHFPSRLVLAIYRHAKERGLKIDPEKIPTLENEKASEQRSAA